MARQSIKRNNRRTGKRPTSSGAASPKGVTAGSIRKAQSTGRSLGARINPIKRTR